MYSSWLATSYGIPFTAVLVWSYHGQFRYPFALVPLWEWMYNAHDTFWDIVTITLETGARILREASHLFPCHTQWWMDILITRDDFRTLMDIIIVDSTHTNMVQWTLTTTTHVVMMATQEKTWSYIERALGNDFIPFVIKTYRCCHFHFDSFFWLLVHKPLSHVINGLL